MARSRPPESRNDPGAVLPPAAATPPAAGEVEACRQCPVCYQGYRGVGTAYSTQGRKRYYKCGACGHTWTHVLPPETVQVDHRTALVDFRESLPDQARRW